jgi:hypothetical protein
MLGSLAVLLTSNAASAACPTPTSTSDLVRAVGSAESAFSSMNETAFTSARDRAREVIPCLAETVDTVDVAAVHRMEAFDAFLARDDARVEGAFHASIVLQPSWLLPSELASSSSPLREAYATAARLPEGTHAELRPPAGASVVVDGQRSSTRDISRPAFVQLVAHDGTVLWSGYMPIGDESPSWAEAEHEPALVGHRRQHLVLGATAIGTALAAGAVYAHAMSEYDTFVDPSTPYAELKDARTGANVSTVAAAGLGAASVSLTFALAFTW